MTTQPAAAPSAATPARGGVGAALPALGLLAVLALGWLLRLYKLSRQSLSGDEIATLAASRSPDLPAFLQSYAGYDHPPLYFLAERLWTPFAGTSEFALRFPSAAAGLLAVAGMYAVGRQLGGRGFAVVAALLGAAAPFWVFFGQESRGYAFMLLGCVAALWLALRAARADAGSRTWLAWGVVAGLTGLTEYTALPVLGLQGAYLAWVALRSGRWRALLLAGAPPVLLVGGWLLYANPLQSVYETHSDLTPRTDPLDVLLRSLNAFAAGNFVADDLLLAAAAPLLVALLAGLVLWRGDWARRLLLAAVALAPLAAVVLVAGNKLGFNPRYVLASSPAVLLLAAAAIAWAGRRAWPVAGLATLTVLAPAGLGLHNYYNEPFFGRTDFRGAADFLSQEYRSGDVVIFNAPWGAEPFQYYATRTFATVGMPSALPLDMAVAERELNDLRARYNRLWLVRWQDWFTDTRREIRGWLDNHTTKIHERGYAYITVEGYTNQPVAQPAPAQPPLLAEFGGRARLSRYAADAAPIAENGRLVVTLWWWSQGPLDRRYKGFVHLVDAAGRLVAQEDHEPVYGRLPTANWPANTIIQDTYEVQVPPDLPSGSYSLWAGMYAADGDRLRLPNGDDHLVLNPALPITR